MRVLGVDPGLRITGYACIEPGPIRPLIIEAGVFRLPRTHATLAQRLDELDRDFTALLQRTSPQVVAIEGLFAHYKHPATAIIMGHGRGVLLLAAQRAGLSILELKPTQVKKSLTGFGGADKAQVQRAVQAECGLPAPPSPPDLADALAIALCTLHRRHAALAD